MKHQSEAPAKPELEAQDPSTLVRAKKKPARNVHEEAWEAYADRFRLTAEDLKKP